MAWTLGELAFFCYTSAVEAQDSRGVPAAQAVHHINFFEAARFIASERGILGRTSDDVLKRVSVSMAERFVKSRLPEALESFIIEYGPPPCKPTARLLPAANARSQPSNPAAVHQGVASATAASYGTGSGPSHTNLASGSARISAGPRQSQPVQCSDRAADPASLRRWQPLFRNYGTQTWDSLLTPRWRLMLEPHGEVEEQEIGAPCSATGEFQAGAFRRSCGTQTWGSLVARVSRPSAGQEPKPDVQTENPPEAAPQEAISPVARSAMPSQAPPAHQAPGPPTQQPIIAADTVQIGDNHTGVRDTGMNNAGVNNTGVNNAGASDAGNASARLWEHTCRMRRAPSIKCESTNSDTDLVPDGGELGMELSAAVKCDRQAVLQQLLCPPTPGEARRSPLRKRQGPLPPPSASPQVPPSQQHKQHPPMALRQRPQQWHQEQCQWQHQQQWQHQPLPSQRRHWQQQPSRNRAPGRSPSNPSSGEPRCPDSPKAVDKLFPQPNVGGPEGRGNTHAVVEATARSAANLELQHGEFQPQWEQQKHQGPGQGRHHQEHQEHRQGHHLRLGQQQSPLQPPLEQQAGQCCAEGAREHEAQQQMAPTPSPEKQPCGRPSVTNQLRLARHCEEERGASAAAAAAVGMVAAEHQVVHVQSSHFAGSERASGAVAAAAVAAGEATTAAATAIAPAVGHQCRSAGPVGAAATAAFGTRLTEPLFGQLRREYDKRLANAALEKRLRNHLCKKGNSSIRQYCIKEGMPWTLLEVVCYGVALQKMAIQPFGVDSAIEFLARVKGWRLANEGTNTANTEAAESRRPCELSPSLVQKVAAAMAGAISKYSLMNFIERQHRNKRPPRPPPQQQQQQQQELGAVAEPAVEAWRLEPAALGDAMTNAEVAAAAGAGAGVWLRVPQQNAPRSHANQSPSETIGTTVVMAPAINTTAAPSPYPPQHSCSGDSGSRGIGRHNNCATISPDAAVTSGAAAAVSLLQEQLGSGVARCTNGRRGSGARSRALEVRLRAHLQKLNVRSLRRCNLSEGVGWTLLDLAEKDRDVRLQMGCEDFQDADVVRRLLDAKVGPGSQLSPAAIQTVSECVRRAHRKYRIGDFVAAEIRKHIKRKRSGSTGDAARGTPAAAPIGAGAVVSAGANGASS
ncbi:hypothetical protein Vretifemale_15556 [Volvox reticuliferus]|nr:hypothetical protein Vretifemale_15556 [Volvox reticuliferus]